MTCSQAKGQRHSADDFISSLSQLFSLMFPVPLFLYCHVFCFFFGLTSAPNGPEGAAPSPLHSEPGWTGGSAGEAGKDLLAGEAVPRLPAAGPRQLPEVIV